MKNGGGNFDLFGALWVTGSAYKKCILININNLIVGSYMLKVVLI